MKITLAEGKKTQYAISVTPGADRVLKFAAKELSAYLEKISCAEFSVSGNAKGKRIELVSGGNAEMDSFETQISDGSIKIHGANSRSVLYGVYDFLEKIGCSFVEPECEIVPSTDKLTVGFGSYSQKASFKLRCIFRIQIRKTVEPPYDGFEEHHLAQIDWMAKRKLNHYDFYIDYNRYDLWEKHKHQVLDALLDRGFTLEVAHHSIGYFCPKTKEEDFGNYGPESYLANHPEWYEDNQVHIENPEVQKLLTTRLIDYARRNPELKMIGLWPGDSGMACPYPGMNQADGYLKFWNPIAEALAVEFPEKKLSILSYLDLLNPPVKFDGNPNLNVWWCPIRHNYMYPITDEQHNPGYVGKLQGWIQKMPALSVNSFEYYGWKPIFTPFIHKMQSDLSTYSMLGLGGIYGWCGFTYNLMGNNYRWAREMYVLSCLQWDVKADVEVLAVKWAHAVFGEAAPEVIRFYGVLQKRHAEECVNGMDDSDNWIDFDLLMKLLKIIERIKKKSVSEFAMKRIRLLGQLAANGAVAELRRMPGKFGNAW